MAYGAIVGQSPDTTKIEQKIDSIEKNYVPKSGTTMTGALNMGNHKVSGVANGTSNNDVVNKGQLDEVKNSAASVPFNKIIRLVAQGQQHIIDSTNVLFRMENTNTIYMTFSILPLNQNGTGYQDVTFCLRDGSTYYLRPTTNVAGAIAVSYFSIYYSDGVIRFNTKESKKCMIDWRIYQ